MITLRPYQREAVDRVFEAWEESGSTLVVMPTGTGKTITFAEIIRRAQPKRCLVLAHREELIFQAADKIRALTGLDSQIEMADQKVAANGFWLPNIIVSSIQTQCAGRNGGRMQKFDPQSFGVVIVDEAHHAPAKSYRRVLEHYQSNPDVRILGVTATPDRADEKALGQIFDTVAYDYEIVDAINEGWLCPIRQTMVSVEDLDFSSVRTTAGDLNGKDLALIMEQEEMLHELVTPTLEITGDRRTIIFAASVFQAERISDIIGRHGRKSAWVCGKTKKDNRREILSEFADGKIQYMVNVGVLTEGFDDPGVEAIVMGRPTKSRALYAQMAGRGTRPLPGVIDGLDCPDLRKLAIAKSGKPACEVIDFVGNSGRHRLMSTADILGGRYDDDVISLATSKAKDRGSSDMGGLLEEAFEEIEEAKRRREEERLAEEARRREIKASKAKYRTSSVDPFSVFHIQPERERGWSAGKKPTDRMVSFLEKQNIDANEMTYTEAQQLIREIKSRWDNDLCTFKQAKLLKKHGLPSDVSFDVASKMITAIANNGWRSLPPGALAQFTPPPMTRS